MIRAGEKIGPYTVVRKLGRGTFGVVWLAEKRTALAVTKVALKLPNDDDIDLESVKREAAVWVEASGHPNVLPIIDADIYDEQVVIVSEYAPDGSLADWLKKHGGKAPTIEAAVEMTASVLDGLAHLHARRIIHRDLKPANILLQGKTPRLADFGLARVLKTTGQSSNVSGTYAYMPPEAFDGKRSEQTDVWSAGVILYQMLTSRLPYPQTDDAALVSALLTREPEPPPDDLPPALRAVLKYSLQRNLAERYQSAAEMREALLGAGSPPAPVPTAPPAAPELEYPTRKFPAPPVDPIITAPPPTPPSPILKPGIYEGQVPQIAPPQRIIAPVPVIGGSSLSLGSGVPEKRRSSLWLIVSVLAGVLIIGLVIAGSLGAFSSKDDSKTNQPEISRATKGGSAMPPLWPSPFDTLKLEANGNVIERRKGQAQAYSEEISGVHLEMVKIPSGTFKMGSPDTEKDRNSDEGPQHQVNVSEYYIGKYEVTQEQWRVVASLPKVEIDLNPNPSRFKGHNLPVESVSWDEAVEFCARLSKATGRAYRLPSEAEWEYAARGGTETLFAFGDTIRPEIVNYNGDEPYGGVPKGIFRQKTTAVGSLDVANGFGLYDMYGNVWEWCADVWHENYNGAPTDGTAWMSGGNSMPQVMRGGSWGNGASILRSAVRSWFVPFSRDYDCGFRVVASART